MNTTSPCPPDGNPGDEAFEVFLATADDQLLAHVRSHTDPVRVLNALLDVLDEPTTAPAYPYTTPRKEVTEKLIQRLTSRLTVQTLVIDLAHAYDLVSTLTHVRLTIPFALDLAEHLAAVRDLVHNLEADLVPNFDVGRGLDRLFHRLDSACASIRRLDPGSSRLDVLALLSSLSLVRDLKIAMEIREELLRSPVDVSGVDLTRLDAAKAVPPAQVVQALDGVVWDDSTRWPTGLKKTMVVWSEPIEGSRYRVRAGNERDSHVR